ncbi:MAG: undecaprenyl diphosphate synthase family protein [Halobacteria archaeon]
MLRIHNLSSRRPRGLWSFGPRALLTRIYERRLEREVSRDPLPRSLLLVTEAREMDGPGVATLRSFIEWCSALDIHPMVSVSGATPSLEEPLVAGLEGFPWRLLTREGERSGGGPGEPAVTLILGLGGREELLLAIRAILRRVKAGELAPSQIDDRTVEAHLRVRREPDLIIRGGGRLSDFLIWQSIYSELYFTEVPWRSFRRIDLLRTIRDYQSRKRRFGK